MKLFATWSLAVLIAAGTAGCLGGADDDTPDPGQGTTTSVFDRAGMAFNTTDAQMSHTLEAGPYGIQDGRQYFVPVQLGPEEGAGTVAGIDVSVGVHFPEIPGCDWDAEDLPAECRVPVIADVGPYYSATVGRPDLQTEGDAAVHEYTHNRLMGTLVENFVPHGYAVAAVSVLGTGDSGHCMDLMGRAEQLGVQAAVDFLGSEAWSNGAVALIGRSYDGSTPWEAAMGGSPYLKTIVPISGLMGQHDLMWRNGSVETRGPGVLYALYAAMTIDGDVSDATQVLCPDYLLGAPSGGLSYLTGGTQADAAYDYWQERYFYDDVVANFNGSIYYIHGLQDWNVDNHQAFPYYNQLLAEGYEMKGLFGQWAHHYPDRAREHGSLPSGYGGEAAATATRYDWAQDLLEWFDHYLKGTGDRPELHVEVQDNQGQWRVEQTYPPQDATLVELAFGDAEVELVGGSPLGPVVSPRHSVRLTFPALSDDEDTRIAGNVRMPVTLTPTGSGGQIGATLYDATNGLRLGHAIMDLRYAAGGKEAQPVVAGQPLVAKVEFLAMDVVLPAGHGLELVLEATVMDYLPSTTTNPVLVDTGGASTLLVPTVERSDDVFFQPPQE